MCGDDYSRCKKRRAEDQADFRYGDIDQCLLILLECRKALRLLKREMSQCRRHDRYPCQEPSDCKTSVPCGAAERPCGCRAAAMKPYCHGPRKWACPPARQSTRCYTINN